MSRNTGQSVTRYNDLQQQIALLADLSPAENAIVSCYLDLTLEPARLEAFVRSKLASHVADVPQEMRFPTERCVGAIMSQARVNRASKARGLAVFISTAAGAAVISALPFAVSFTNGLTVSKAADLYPLIRMREVYARFMVVIARPEALVVYEVNLGDLSYKAWIALQNTSDRSLPDSDVTHDGTDKQQDPQLALIERVLRMGGPCPFFIAGSATLANEIETGLSSTARVHLVQTLWLPDHMGPAQIANFCQNTMIAIETQEARDLSARVLNSPQTGNTAVVGAGASLNALLRGTAERLLIGKDYRPGTGWTCGNYRRSRNDSSSDGHCNHYSREGLQAMDLRVELLRLAGRNETPVDFADDEALSMAGGVACVLSNRPELRARPAPQTYRNLGLAA